MRGLERGLIAAVMALSGPIAGDRAVAADTAPAAPVAAATPLPVPWYCMGWRDGQRRADGLLAGVYQLGTHRAVEIGPDPSWRENPLEDDNWRFLHHSLWAVMSLFNAWSASGDERYLDRAAALLRDWHLDNPRHGAPSPFSWNDHSTALRANVYACARTWLPAGGWLDDALLLHGRMLAAPDFYVRHGNHALNQSIGLLEVGVVMRRADWRRLAAERINRLVGESVDVQGVTNEQSVVYQGYNFQRYTRALRRLVEVGLPTAEAFSRVARMPGFMAHATLPDGTYETLGDTDPGGAAIVPGTWAEFAATQGRAGPKPGDTVAVYHAGFMFARTGWGERRPMADETFMSLRWGPGPNIHGHADHGSVTLYGHGARLLVDPGRYTYNLNEWRSWFKRRSAHNIVSVDGAAWRWEASSRLLRHARTAAMADAVVRMNGVPGVTHRRHATFSRRLGYVLVEDTLTSRTSRTYRQLWHLPADANPLVRATYFYSRRDRGNVQVQQLLNGSWSRVVKGRTSPIQGWIATAFGQRTPAPVVEVARSGRNVRFLTLLVAAPDRPRAEVSQLRLTPTGYSVVITMDGRSERVTVDGTSASIVPLSGPPAYVTHARSWSGPLGGAGAAAALLPG